MIQNPTTQNRPKAVFFWNNADVMKWLKRHCETYHGMYGNLFLEQEITGRSLVRMNDITLERMGVGDAKHRDELCGLILKLKLKSDILEMKDLEKKNSDYGTTNSSSSSMTVGCSYN